MSYYREQLEAFLKSLDVRASVVYDLGGAQKPVKGRTKSWDVGKYEVLDLPGFDIQKGRPGMPRADVIFCLEVFEYLIDPAAAFRTVAAMLAPKGAAYATFPLVYPVHNEVESDSLRYTLSGVTRLAAHAGLAVSSVVARRAKTPTLVRYYQEDGMRMAKGVDHHVTGYIVRLTN